MLNSFSVRFAGHTRHGVRYRVDKPPRLVRSRCRQVWRLLHHAIVPRGSSKQLVDWAVLALRYSCDQVHRSFANKLNGISTPAKGFHARQSVPYPECLVGATYRQAMDLENSSSLQPRFAFPEHWSEQVGPLLRSPESSAEHSLLQTKCLLSYGS